MTSHLWTSLDFISFFFFFFLRFVLVQLANASFAHGHLISERVSTDEKNLDCSSETRFQHEHIFMNFSCPTREWAKWVSEPVNGLSKRSEWSKWVEWAVRANKRSERPRGPLKTRLSRVETDPMSVRVVTAWVGAGHKIFFSNSGDLHHSV